MKVPIKVGAVTVVLIIVSFSFLPHKSVGLKFAGNFGADHGDEKKMVLGSRPPGCKNKCLSCRPCMATLVVPVHGKGSKAAAAAAAAIAASARDEDDGYYLLSWKCRCGNRIYQP